MSTKSTSARPHYQFWPARLPEAVVLPETTLWDNLQTSARRYPNQTAIVFLGSKLSYAQLEAQALSVAAYLKQLGVVTGDRVVLCMQNCPQLIVAHFAILRLGAVVVPVNPMNKAHELEHYIVDPDTRVAITTADLAEELAKASNDLPEHQRLEHMLVSHLSDSFDLDVSGVDAPPEAWVAWLTAQHPHPLLAGRGASHQSLVHDWKKAIQTDASQLPPLRASALDLAIMPYTSGTTGLPKGCEHTHRSIMHNTIANGLWGSLSPAVVTLIVVPMFHITGMVSVMHTSIYHATTMVLMPRWDRDFAGRMISKYKVTHWTNIPTMVMDLLASPRFSEYDLTSLINIGGGGAAMPQAVAQRLLDVYGLTYVEGYGLTETAAPSHVNPPDRAKQQCLGIPYMSTDARVWNPETRQECVQGEEGEIIICGPQVFRAYWKRPDATAEAFIEFEGKRFFRSGDIGRMDEDGYFFMTDRLKRMINASGFKVWPAEVEALMFKHEAIAEACVVGSRDAHRGETVKAYVVLRQAFKEKVTEQMILDWCRDNMAVYKAPKIVEFVDSLPKSGSGKTMWRALQENELAKS